MKEKKMKKWTKIFLSLLLVFSMAGCAQSKDTPVVLVREDPTGEIQEKFDLFLLEMYKETISSDALSLHYSLVNPEAYDIKLDEISIGEISEASDMAYYAQLKEWKQQLDSYNLSDLNTSQQDDYFMVENYLKIQLMAEGLDYYGNLFSPASSVTSNLVTNFVEYRIYKESDFEEYLTLLADIDRFIEDSLIYTQKQVNLGLYMKDYTVDDTVDEISKFTAKTDDNELIITFEDKLDLWEGLDDTTREEYANRNRDIIINQVIPAYKKVATQLKSWKGSATTTGGYASLPQGKTYYEALFRYKTGYMGDIDELFEKGKQALIGRSNEIIGVLQTDNKVIDRYSEFSFEEKEPNAILQEYQKMLLKEFPEGPEVSYIAEFLDPSIANDNTIAYYLIPPYDEIKDNVIRINPKQTSNTTTLYTTLAHEGFPGHLYQTTFYYATSPHPIRTQFDSLGYIEGWAMYTELESISWHMPKDPKVALFIESDIYIPYLLQAMIDIGVNYYDWDQAEVKDFLAECAYIYGMDNDDTAKGLREAVISNPGMILPYGVGLLEMTLLREKAESELGKKFNLVRYHEAILNAGPVTFDLLEQKVNEFIESYK